MHLNPEDARDICAALVYYGTTVQSKHIIVSDTLKDTLQEVLDAKPPGSGREKYHLRRAGEISQESRAPLLLSGRVPPPTTPARTMWTTSVAQALVAQSLVNQAPETLAARQPVAPGSNVLR